MPDLSHHHRLRAEALIYVFMAHYIQDNSLALQPVGVSLLRPHQQEIKVRPIIFWTNLNYLSMMTF